MVLFLRLRKTEGKINQDALDMAEGANAAVRDAESGLVFMAISQVRL